MSTEPSPSVVVPKPVIPRTIGTLNIIFASLLLLCSACGGFAAILMPTFIQTAQMEMKKTEDLAKAKRSAEITKLQEQEKTAQTEAEKAGLKQKRLDLEDRNEIASFSINPLTMIGMNNPIVHWITVGDLISAMLLNLLMLIAGIGLLRLQEWGRKLGLWIAGIKIVRLMVVYSIMAVVVTPITSKSMSDYFKKIEEVSQRQAARRGNAAPPILRQQQITIAKSMAAMQTAQLVVMGVLGSIYPAITLWLLSTPGSRAACRSTGTGKPRTEMDDPWAAS
jgi:hypothetical protein